MENNDNAPSRFVIVDLEATCWEGHSDRQNEIIEIGAVAYEVDYGVSGEYQTFVRPKLNPLLSDFCTHLTSIRQRDVDLALDFPSALADFVEWTRRSEPFVLASWGDYDRKQLHQDCELHDLEYPFGRHVNLKKVFALLEGRRKQCGMRQALRMLQIPLDGTHHRSLDDARNIAKILDARIGSFQHIQSADAKT